MSGYNAYFDKKRERNKRLINVEYNELSRYNSFGIEKDLNTKKVKLHESNNNLMPYCRSNNNRELSSHHSKIVENDYHLRVFENYIKNFKEAKALTSKKEAVVNSSYNIANHNPIKIQFDKTEKSFFYNQNTKHNKNAKNYYGDIIEQKIKNDLDDYFENENNFNIKDILTDNNNNNNNNKNIINNYNLRSDLNNFKKIGTTTPLVQGKKDRYQKKNNAKQPKEVALSPILKHRRGNLNQPFSLYFSCKDLEQTSEDNENVNNINKINNEISEKENLLSLCSPVKKKHRHNTIQNNINNNIDNNFNIYLSMNNINSNKKKDYNNDEKNNIGIINPAKNNLENNNIYTINDEILNDNTSLFKSNNMAIITNEKQNDSIKYIYSKKYNEIISDSNSDSYYEENAYAVKEYAYKEEANLRYRPHMEDKGKLIDCFNENQNNILLCLFDGHGGNQVSTYLQENFPEVFKNILTSQISVDENSIEESLKLSFENIDKKIKKSFSGNIGSTGCIIYITKIKTKKYLFCANIGDTRCVLVYNKGVKRLSYDHKATDESEYQRIINSGGVVVDGRVDGEIMLSRAFGDADLKECGLISIPHIYKKIIDNNDNYLVIASDGIWDVYEDLEMFSIGRNEPNAKEFCDEVIKTTLEKGSNDNLSCFVIKF